MLVVGPYLLFDQPQNIALVLGQCVQCLSNADLRLEVPTVVNPLHHPLPQSLGSALGRQIRNSFANLKVLPTSDQLKWDRARCCSGSFRSRSKLAGFFGVAVEGGDKIWKRLCLPYVPQCCRHRVANIASTMAKESVQVTKGSLLQPGCDLNSLAPLHIVVGSQQLGHGLQVGVCEGRRHPASLRGRHQEQSKRRQARRRWTESVFPGSQSVIRLQIGSRGERAAEVASSGGVLTRTGGIAVSSSYKIRPNA
jgi:hypothetical protein